MSGWRPEALLRLLEETGWPPDLRAILEVLERLYAAEKRVKKLKAQVQRLQAEQWIRGRGGMKL